MLIHLAAIGALTLACGDRSPTAVADPSSQGRARAAVTAAPVGGCLRVQVTLAGRDSVAVAVLPSECGPIAPVLAAGATYDRARRVVVLPIALESRGTAAVRAPAFLYSWDDSLQVLSPPGLAGNKHTAEYLAFLRPDSVASDTASLLASASIWRMDSTLSGGPRGGRLAAGERSRARRLEISVKQGVSAFLVVLGASATPAAPEVPPSPPNTWPADAYAPEHLGPGTRIPLDLVMLWFKPGTSVADKQAAIESVGGEVVGGGRPPQGVQSEGYYLVRIQHDGTFRPLLDALRRLEQSPHVDTAILVARLSPAGLSPKDGPGFQEWSFDPDYLAHSLNWAQEVVNAPMAWGCETGWASATTAIGIVDAGFSPDLDLANVSAHGSSGAGSGHATEVAAIVAATGNNDQGMTGVMWRAKVDMWAVDTEASTGLLDSNDFYQKLAVAASGKVVNLSEALDWHALGVDPKKDSALAVATVKTANRLLIRVLEEAARSYSFPLVIVAAGNDGLDAYWGGFSEARAAFPDQVVIVGGVGRGPSTRQGETVVLPRYQNSNTGAAIDIAAPADNVVTLVPGQALPFPVSGTSYAAPFVSGAAGLLLSFDPQLRTTELKALLVQGAVNGAHRAGSTDGPPVLNIYESLKAAAQKPGKRLCGNPLWITSTGFAVGRGTTPEPVRLNFSPAGLVTYHGGRLVTAVDTGYSELTATLEAGKEWRSVPLPDTVSMTGSQYARDAKSHDGGPGVLVQYLSYWPNLRATLKLYRNGQTTDLKGFGAEYAGVGGYLSPAGQYVLIHTTKYDANYYNLEISDLSIYPLTPGLPETAFATFSHEVVAPYLSESGKEIGLVVCPVVPYGQEYPLCRIELWSLSTGRKTYQATTAYSVWTQPWLAGKPGGWIAYAP